jgi:hypothetical protein
VMQLRFGKVRHRVTPAKGALTRMNADERG